jgi:hypothetical protein
MKTKLKPSLLLAMTLVVACIAVTVVAIVGGTAIYVVIKVCKNIPKPGTNTNGVLVVTMDTSKLDPPKDHGGPIINPMSLQDLRFLNDWGAGKIMLAAQRSVDLTNWETLYYVTGQLQRTYIAMGVLDAKSNLCFVQNVIPDTNGLVALTNEALIDWHPQPTNAFYRLWPLE